MKIKPNKLFKKWERFSQTHLENPENHNFWLLGPSSQRSQEQGVKEEMLEMKPQGKVSSNLWVGHHKSPSGSAQRKVGWSRAGWIGTHTAGTLPTAVGHTKAWPTGIPTSRGWHLPLQTISFCFERCRGVISGGRARADAPVGNRHGKDQTGALRSPLAGEVRDAFRLFTDLLVIDQHFFGWSFCFLSNHMLSTGDSQQVSHAWFKALAPCCFPSWRVEIHNFH